MNSIFKHKPEVGREPSSERVENEKVPKVKSCKTQQKNSTIGEIQGVAIGFKRKRSNNGLLLSTDSKRTR